MAIYIMLASFTDQGIRKVSDSPKRTDAFKEMAKKCGATVRDAFWTLHFHDRAWIEQWRPWKCSHANAASVYASRHEDDRW